MNNPLLMHIYFKSKVTVLLEQYKNESIEADRQHGLMRDLLWSERKRDDLCASLLKIFEIPTIQNASSVSAYKQSFSDKLNAYLVDCTRKRIEYNHVHKTTHQPGNLETIYVNERIVNMVDHLTSLYGIYNLSKTGEKEIIGDGNLVAYNRNVKLKELFDILYNKSHMYKEDYEKINSLISSLVKFQEGFENTFQLSIDEVQGKRVNPAAMKKPIQAFKDKNYDIELEKTLKTLREKEYETAVRRSEATASAQLSTVLSTTWSWAACLTSDASKAINDTAIQLGNMALNKWVQTRGSSSTTINATSDINNTDNNDNRNTNNQKVNI